MLCLWRLAAAILWTAQQSGALNLAPQAHAMSICSQSNPLSGPVYTAQQPEGLNAGMRAEEFTAAKEQRTKQMGAEIITADTSYQPEGESMEK